MPYDDSGVEFEIRADDRKARPVTDRVNSSIDRIEKSAAKMLDTVGRASDSLHRTMLRAAAAADKMYDSLGAVATTAGHVITRTLETAAAFLAVGKAATLAGSGGQNLINVYRGVRLALSPTMFTAASIAAVALAHEIYVVTKARYELIKVEAMAAAQAGMSYRSYSTFAGAERLTGIGGSGTFTSGFKGYKPDVVLKLAGEISGTSDPVERARMAVEAFGESADKVLPLLDSRFQSNVDHAYALSLVLDTKARKSLSDLGDSLPHPTQRLRELGDAFRYAAEASRVAVTKMVADFYEWDKTWSGGGMSRGIAARERGTEAFGREYDPKTGKLLPRVPQFLEIERQMLGYLPGEENSPITLAPEVPTLKGVMFEGQAIASSYLSSKEGLQSRLGNLQTRRATLAEAIGTSKYPTLIAQALIPIDREMKVVEARIKVLDRQEELLKKEEEAARKLAEGTIELREKISATMLNSMSRSLSWGGGVMTPNPDFPKQGFSYTAEEQDRLITRGVRTLNVGLPVTGRTSNADLQARFNDNLKDTDRYNDRQLAHRIRMVELTAGPGGEAAAVEKIYQLRVAAGKTAEDQQQAIYDREIGLFEIQKKHFDELRSSFEGLFDAAFSGARSFWDAVKRMALSVFLTPIKREMSNWVAGMLTGRTGASSGGGSTTGGILSGIFGGLFGARQGTASTLTPENAVAGAYQMGPMGMGLGGSMAGMGGGGGLGQFGPMAAMDAAGGWQGMAMGAGQMAGTMGGLALATAGAKRGGLSGAGMLGGGAALTALALGFGPLGILAIGGVALGAGLIRMLWKSAEQKVIDKVQQLYRVRIDKPLAQQIVEMAKSAYGGNLDMAIRAPQGRELIELYAMATGQNMMGLAAKQFPTTMSQSRGVMTQAPNYFNGLPYVAPVGATTGLGGGGTTVVIQPSAADMQRLLTGQVVSIVTSNPRATATASMEANRQSFNRRELAAMALQPGLVLS